MVEKMKPIPIGKSKNPRALKRANMARLPVHYRYQNKAWMVGGLFEEFLFWFDKEVRKNNKERRVLLFMDNESVHKSVVQDLEQDLKHTTVISFFANTTSHTQPLDSGIIQAVKLA